MMKALQYIGIGVGRCGTTSFHSCLCQHPLILRAAKKEINYYDRYYHRGLGWYRSQFPVLLPGEITGEFSPDYIFPLGIAPRIRADYPDMKLIVLLRNPIESTFSYYWFAMIKHNRFQYDFATAIRENPQQMIDRRFYDVQLEHWFRHFPREQFLIIRSEDMFSDYQAVMNSACEFLGVPEFAFSEEWQGNQQRLDKVMLPDDRSALAEIFALHNRRLEQILGRKFNWEA